MTSESSNKQRKAVVGMMLAHVGMGTESSQRSNHAVRKASYGGSLFMGEVLEMFTNRHVALRPLVRSGRGPSVPGRNLFAERCS